MTIKTISDSERNPSKSTDRTQRATDAAVDRLAGLLPAEALEDPLKGLEREEITGPGGLLTQLAGRVIETALRAELTAHLGHPPAESRTAPTAQRQRAQDGADRSRCGRDQDAAGPRRQL